MTIGTLAKKHDYYTACIGKWHLGWDWPIAQGQAQHFRGLGGAKGANTAKDPTPEQIAAWKEVFSKQIPGGPTSRGFDLYFGTDVPNWPPYCYIENDRTVGIPSTLLPLEFLKNNQASLQGPALQDWKLDPILPALADRACDVIAKQAKAQKPFLIYMPLTAPHTPIAVAKEWQGKSGLNAYADFVMQTDATVGRVLDAIKQAGIENNTLVVFTSDNGCASYIGAKDLEAKGHFPSGPLRGYKADAWEGGHRIPFIVRWPGQVKPGTICNSTICSVDLLATLAEILRTKFPGNAGEDSVSLLPALKGETKPIHETVVHQSSTGVFCIRSGKWKLILFPPTDAKEKMTPHLYDLEADLAETKNLATEQSDQVKQLLAKLEKMIADGRSTPGESQANDVKVQMYKNLPKAKK
jgi:arylsulfatase A-like enzyme